jgi:hypothetical protein
MAEQVHRVPLRTPEQKRMLNTLRRYRLRPGWYKLRFEEQNGGCAICGEPPKGERPLMVDHDHACCDTMPTCGKCHRGLLCHTCNTALASVERVSGWSQKAEAYLRRTGRDVCRRKKAKPQVRRGFCEEEQAARSASS